jgi:hypothetical protein
MAPSTEAVRTHVVFSRDLVETIDRVAGKRKRSEFAGADRRSASAHAGWNSVRHWRLLSAFRMPSSQLARR